MKNARNSYMNKYKAQVTSKLILNEDLINFQTQVLKEWELLEIVKYLTQV